MSTPMPQPPAPLPAASPPSTRPPGTPAPAPTRQPDPPVETPPPTTLAPPVPAIWTTRPATPRPSPTTRRAPQERWIVASLALAAGLAARGWLAWARPIWLDEGASLSVARDPAGVWSATLARDLHPPLFAALATPWSQPALPPEFVRLPSLLAGFATVALAGLAARTWGGSAWVGAALAACSAPQLLYATEGRPYALAMLAITALLALAGPEVVEREDRANLPVPAPTWQGLRVALLPAVAALAPFTTHAAGPVAVLILTTLTITLPGRKNAVFAPAAALAAIATAVDLLLIAAPQREAAGDALLTGFLARHFATAIPNAGLPGAFAAATIDHLTWSFTGAGSASLRPIGGVALALLVAAVALGGRAVRALAPALALSWATFFVLSALGLHPYGGIRQLAPLVPLATLPIAVLLSAGRWRYALGPIAAIGLGAALVGPGLPWEDQPALLALLRGRVKDGDVIYVDAAAAPAFDAYAPLGWRGKSQTLPWAEPAALPRLRPPELGSAWVITSRIHPEAGEVLGERWKFERTEVLIARGVRAEHWTRGARSD